jgi:hypothetical protein
VRKLIAHRVDCGEGNAGEFRWGIWNRIEKVSGGFSKNLEVADNSVLQKAFDEKVRALLPRTYS